jgi:hypothetical protein
MLNKKQRVANLNAIRCFRDKSNIPQFYVLIVFMLYR